MGFLSRLTDIDPDEVSPVRRGANRRRLLLMKEDVAEVDDMLAVPVAYEGALTDLLRKEGTDDAVIEATVAALRLLKAAEEDLPEPIRELVEKLGMQMYPIVNKPLNTLDDAQKPTSGTNAKAKQTTAAYSTSGTAGSDADLDSTVDSTVETKGSAMSDQGTASDEDDISKEDLARVSKAEPGDGDEPDAADDVAKADLSTAGRASMTARGEALADGSFPIPNVAYLKRAIQAFGRASDKPRAKAWIMRRARALNRTDLIPTKWSGGSTVNKEGTMSEGAATVPVPIKKDDGSWDLSGIPEESRPFFEDVLGGRDEIAKQRDELRERLEKAETNVAEERDKRLDREYIAKAEGFKHVASPDELGPVLKEIAGKIESEQFEILEKALAAAEERIVQSDLFKEVGRTGAAAAGEESVGDAYSQLEKMAAELVEKTGDLTPEKAFDSVLKTDAGRALYRQYMAEV